MTKELTCWVERYRDGSCTFYAVNCQYGDGGTQHGPFATRAAAREAALKVIEEIEFKHRGRRA